MNAGIWKYLCLADSNNFVYWTYFSYLKDAISKLISSLYHFCTDQLKFRSIGATFFTLFLRVEVVCISSAASIDKLFAGFLFRTVEILLIGCVACSWLSRQRTNLIFWEERQNMILYNCLKPFFISKFLFCIWLFTCTNCRHAQDGKTQKCQSKTEKLHFY